jgi:hypothetical protein
MKGAANCVPAFSCICVGWSMHLGGRGLQVPWRKTSNTFSLIHRRAHVADSGYPRVENALATSWRYADGILHMQSRQTSTLAEKKPHTFPMASHDKNKVTLSFRMQ